MLGEKETYEYLGILEAGTIKQAETKKCKKSISGKRKKLLETKLYSRNLIKGINTWAVLAKFSGQFLKWTKEELQQMDQRTRKLMLIHKRDNIDRLHVSRKGR